MVLDDQRGGLKQPDLNMLQFRIGANRVAKGPVAYETGNAIVIKQKKREVLYKNGFTLPVTAERLIAEAERTTRHSAKLSRNLNAAGQRRPPAAAPRAIQAHHIVAANDERAHESRMRLFRWRIGINDADNGAYLPACKTTFVPGLSDAVKHAGLHTDTYYLNVVARFVMVANDDTNGGRHALRQIKRELLDGVFPY